MREIRIFVLCILVLAFGIWLTSPVMAQSISITADRDIIYFGDIITFSGSNSESDTVYLYVTGPNLPWQGGLLTDPRTPINPYVAPLQFTVSEVQDDNTWEYNWQTSNLNIDAGTYTIYAVTTPSDTDQLSETQYDTESVVFIADNRIYPQMPDNTAEEDISTDGQPQIPKSDDKISITANRDLGYLGNEIKLSGTNFDTNETYLFITGPNLPSNGGALTDPKSPICSSPNCYYREFTVTDVNADKTWEYKWQTANLNIDPSTYTIYAVTTSNDKNNLTNAHYATVSVTLRKPYLNAHVSDDVIEQNESLYIRGVAEGDPSQGVAFWIMGRNFVSFNTEAVNDDGTFEYELDEYTTAGMSQGQYFVVVQHPMYNDELDVYPRGDGGYIYRYVFGSYPIANSVLFTLEGPGSPPTSSALNALLFNLNNPNIDDRYVRLSFTIEEPSPPQLTEDYLSATIVSYGGEVIVQGNSKGNPVKGVAIWVIGDDSVNYQVIPVNPNLTYVYKMPTSYLTDGEYAVIVQHPMYNNGFDVYPSADKKFVLGPYPLAGSILFNLQELNSVSHTLATDALVNNLENPNIDDIFIQSKFSVGTGSPPFVEEDKLSVSVQPSTINQGEIVRITGNAKSNPSEGVAIWILGQNYVSYNIASVNGDSFEYEMTGDITRNLSNGKYSVIVQHPMYNDDLDIYPRSDGGYGYRYVVGPYPTTDSVLLILEGPGSLNSDSALNALLNALNNPNVDDQYELVDFGVGTSIEPIQNPTIISLNPSSISKGNEGFTLEVIGANFVDGARVFWEGQERATEFISESKITATILIEDVASEGTLTIKVRNPDGKESKGVYFKVISSSQGPPEIIRSPVEGFDWYSVSGSPFHAVGEGIGGSDDTYAIDLNIGTGYDDEGVPVYAIEDGYVSDMYGKLSDGTPVLSIDKNGNSMGQLLLKHSNGWYSAYVHMKDIPPSFDIGTHVTKGEFIGRISHVTKYKPVSPHLHFAIYIGDNSINGGLKSVQLNLEKWSSTLPYPQRISPPKLVSPGIATSPGQLIDTLQPIFTWESVDGAEKYRIYLRDLDTNNLKCIEINGNFNAYPLPWTLTSNGHYRWNMQSFDGVNWGDLNLENDPDKPKLYFITPSIYSIPSAQNPIWDGDYNDDSDAILLARTLFGEARGQPLEGKIAVAWVIKNRVDNSIMRDMSIYPGKPYHQVILKPYQFSCFNCDTVPGIACDISSEEYINNQRLKDPKTYDSKSWDECYDVAEKVILNVYSDPTNNADHYANPKTATATWVNTEKPVATIGSHNFYRLILKDPIKIIGECPIELQVQDSTGALINSTYNSINNAEYNKVDVNGDGDPDVCIFIPNPILGKYNISVIPLEHSENYEQYYSLSYLMGNTSEEVYLVSNQVINTASISYYSIESNWIDPKPPIASFSINETVGYCPLSSAFEDNSVGIIYNYIWSFGDDTFAENVTAVTHTYTAPGNYTVNLTVSGPDGEDSASQVITVIPFLFSPDGITNLHNSTYLPDSITWTWTDPSSSDFDHVMVYLNGAFQGNVTKGTQIYTATGLSPSTAYTIETRTVGNTGLVNTTWVNQTATTAPDSDPGISPPEAQFTSNITSGTAPLTVQFNDFSIETVTSYEWDFGDGANSTEQNPVHTYTNYGIYNVSLTVTNAAGEDTIIKNDFIQVIPMVGGDTGYYLIHCNVEGAEVYFDQDSKGVITDGTLLVKIYLTATPYHRYSVSKTGYVTINEALPSYPAKDQTKDIFVTLVKVTDDSWTRPPYPEVTKIQPGYPDTNWTRPPYPEVTKIQPGYPDTNWTRPSYPEVTKIQPGYPDTNWTRPSYLNWLWNRPSIKNFLKDIFG